MIIKNKNRRGWVRIVEAFVSILLIISVFLIILGGWDIGETDTSSVIYETEIAVLREIQLDKSLREEILDLETLPVNWDDVDFPLGVREKIEERKPDYLKCEAKICGLGSSCELENYEEKDVYVQSVLITVSPTQVSVFSPRQLKLFCWTD